MKTKNLLWLLISLFLLTAPTLQTFAFGDEVEIVLMEASGLLPGNNPLDNPDQGGGGDTPPRPNEFSATINGQALAISSGTHSAQLIVFDELGDEVLTRQFVGGTIEQIPAPGSYSLEIQSGSLTLVGAFVAQ